MLQVDEKKVRRVYHNDIYKARLENLWINTKFLQQAFVLILSTFTKPSSDESETSEKNC